MFTNSHYHQLYQFIDELVTQLRFLSYFQMHYLNRPPDKLRTKSSFAYLLCYYLFYKSSCLKQL